MGNRTEPGGAQNPHSAQRLEEHLVLPLGRERLDYPASSPALAPGCLDPGPLKPCHGPPPAASPVCDVSAMALERLSAWAANLDVAPSE